MRRLLKEAGRDDVGDAPVAPVALAELARLVDDKVISTSVAKDVLVEMWSTGQSAKAIVEARGLAQIGDASALQALVDEVIAANAETVAQYRGGKTQTFGFLVGQVMKASKGKANPAMVADLMKARLEA